MSVSLWQFVLSVVVGFALIWALLVVALLVAARPGPDRVTLQGVLRLLPDLVRLIHRLAADPALPRGARWRLWLLLGYLLFPIDLVPDFLPVIGYADDAVVIALVLRSVARVAGVEALEQHWPGTPEGLAAVLRLVRPDATQ
ncbi:MAG: DUF1232 domain-containing protein [Nocardioides sp.]